ncbi:MULTISPECIES: hypothetical protein [unclassified Clostridium]|uniref:hypothetical protein n=1 Tax=unclassified Clostridium TaxID=2614128 RepID=UPI0025BB3324|nr:MULTISPECIES: hypothetical protein [unclassified Clostridium]
MINTIDYLTGILKRNDDVSIIADIDVIMEILQGIKRNEFKNVIDSYEEEADLLMLTKVNGELIIENALTENGKVKYCDSEIVVIEDEVEGLIKNMEQDLNELFEAKWKELFSIED